jgi:N-acetylglucosaminyldiphosphoundecaprenol N-acetyl-beta-D-mannosaminyltransferase
MPTSSADAFDRRVHCVLGLPFDEIDTAAAVARVRDAAARRRPTFLSTPNLNFVVGCLGDRAFRDSVIHSDLSVPDGMPVVWVARLLGIPIRERVTGAGLFERLGEPGAPPLKVYFFGGAEGVAAQACRRVNERGAGLVCVGCEYPGFGDLEDLSREDRIESINASGADFLVVSLGARKGQAWIERNRARIRVPVVSHLGAVLNFAAGRVRRAPGWMQQSGLEWLWRVKEEHALWRRYFGDGLAFLRLLATRVAPLAWQLHRSRPSPGELRAAKLVERESWREHVVRLRGAWVAGNLGPLRDCFTRLAPRPKRLRLDLAGVTHADTSFLGLLLLLYGERSRRGLHLSLGPVSPRVERLVRLGCGEFLLGGAR